MENFPVGESKGSAASGKVAQNESKGSAASGKAAQNESKGSAASGKAAQNESNDSVVRGKAAQSESVLEQMPKFCQLILLTLIKFLYLSEDFE